ncbi:hypothetical protein DPMN_137060 [Dreissena polymorpha]|uniref:Neurotransmitter-gated ion-channel transmembrane domain-containing protein n=1 Tax=Dreissena polymorpha TaxID=45954 RepID=A0A9D4G176_DREPO|nr:hypothetical protein DPMN_137060 [Dreissena polymorpha]
MLYSEHEPGAVEFKLVLKRRPSYYMIHIFAPIILLTFLGPLAFVLPNEARSSFAIGLFVTFGVFLTTVASKLPQNSEETPYVSYYLVVMAVLNCIIVSICIVQRRLVVEYESKHHTGFFYRLAQTMGRIEPKKEPAQKMRCIEQKTERNEAEPNEASTVVNMNVADSRLFFFFLFNIFVGSVISYKMAHG